MEYYVYMQRCAVICVVLVAILAAPAARAADPPPKAGTTFDATTKGAPAAAMTGQWQAEGMSARLEFAGVHAVGNRTDMRATWTSDFAPKARSGSITVECYRVSGTVENKANKWEVEVRLIPKSGYGRTALHYSTRVAMTELGSGEGMGVDVSTFRAERWKYQVVIEAHLVQPSEMSGVCEMEAG